MTAIRVIYDEAHKLHSDPTGRHPESPWRLEAALSALRESQVWGLVRIQGLPEPEDRLLSLTHSDHYIELIRRESARGFHYIDSDTYVTEHTFRVSAAYFTAAYRGALESLERGEMLVVMPRPGGHHAGRSGWAMGAPTLGFCIFNYAAAAARALLDRGLRALMIDFDAHHGNGTQDIFWEEPRVLHVDIHEEDIYPGTGYVVDIGGGGAEGTKINVPLPAFSGDPQYLWVLDNVVKPLIEAFKPEAIVVSAGFDAYEGDPLTMLRATDESYEAIASTLREQWVGGRLKALATNIEGGYGEGLRRGFKAYIETLTGIRSYKRSVEPKKPPERISRELGRILSKYWGLESLNS
ncbi:MAG: histone deacetylase family protein [Thermoprotei archaeon]|nr:histone deacetylase family protein [Thermoprotei archaeon]